MSLTVGLVGDIMLGRRVGRVLSRRAPEEIWAPGLRRLASSCDLVIGNLECCVTARGRRTERIPEKPYFFRGPPESVAVLQALSVSAVSLANNHALDYEEEGLADTFAHLAAADIVWAGAGFGRQDAREGLILESGGGRIGLVAASDHPVAYAAIDGRAGIAYTRRGGDIPAWLTEEVSSLRAQCDHVIAFMHWGPNRRVRPAAWQKRLAEGLQSAGASLIAGHSAHVFQGIEHTAKGPVLYDLGDALDDYGRMYGELRNDLGLFALWRPDGGERELEVVGLRLRFGLTCIAEGADADWIAARLERSCREYGTSVDRLSEATFRLRPEGPPSSPPRPRPEPQAKQIIAPGKVLWTGDEVAEITGATSRNGTDWLATDVSYVPRTVRPGDLFVAMNTPYTDGHRDAAEALARGAVAALVSRVPDDVAEEARLLIAPSTTRAVRRLATVARERSEAKTIAVTGSVGKTSTVDALRMALTAQAPTYSCRTNENDDQGALVSLARMPPGVTYAIFELCIRLGGLRMNGLSQKSQWVRPHVVVITRIGLAHLRTYGSIENIADAKANICGGLREGGVAVLNRDDPLFDRLETRARQHGIDRIVTFGEHPEADARLDDAISTGRGSEVFATLHGRELDYELKVIGRHQIINSLAVLAAVEAVGANPEAAASKLSRLRDARGRGRRHVISLEGGRVEVLDHSFNAEPTSMRAAVDSLGALHTSGVGRRIAVLGLQSSENSSFTNGFYAELAVQLLATDVDLLFTVGDDASALRAAMPSERLAPHADTSDELVPAVLAEVRSGDSVLVKGRGATKMSRIVRALLDSKPR
jgi:UDP-N-acetylmuramoyl-tripeptide--D-alanyl-D-alanine ligase